MIYHVIFYHDISRAYSTIQTQRQSVVLWCQVWMNFTIPESKQTLLNLSMLKYFPSFNSLRPRQNRRHFADGVFKCNFLNENVWIPIKISLKFVPKGPINNIPALVQIMAWRRPGDKPLSEAMMVSLPTHICVTRPQWVKTPNYIYDLAKSPYRYNTPPYHSAEYPPVCGLNITQSNTSL